MKKNEAAYIAGILDGEGYLGVSLNSGRYRSRIQIEMTALPLLRWINTKIPEARILKRPIRNKRWRQQYSLVISDNAIPKFLKHVLPFLRLKKNQANVLLRFQKTLFKPGVLGHTEATIRQKEKAHKDSLRLNRRGPR